MFFCTKCGKIIVLKSPSPQGKAKIECSCGNIFDVEKDIILKEKITPGKEIEIADDENILAVHKHICKKCGYDRAELIEIGAMYGDEEDIVRYKCGKCGYVEQLAAKI